MSVSVEEDCPLQKKNKILVNTSSVSLAPQRKYLVQKTVFKQSPLVFIRSSLSVRGLLFF